MEHSSKLSSKGIALTTTFQRSFPGHFGTKIRVRHWPITSLSLWRKHPFRFKNYVFLPLWYEKKTNSWSIASASRAGYPQSACPLCCDRQWSRVNALQVPNSQKINKIPDWFYRATLRGNGEAQGRRLGRHQVDPSLKLWKTQHFPD